MFQMQTVTYRRRKNSMTVGAFVCPSLPLSPSNSSYNSFGGSINRSRLTPKTSRVLRRPLRAHVVSGPSDPSEPEPQSQGTGLPPADTDSSDLALPDLKKLFDKAGDPDCEQCYGEGEIECVVCQGKGFITLTMMGTTSSSQCRMCKGRGKIPCPSCRAVVYKSVLWWDQIPSEEEDPDEKWREGPDGEPRIPWNKPPTSL